MAIFNARLFFGGGEGLHDETNAALARIGLHDGTIAAFTVTPR